MLKNTKTNTIILFIVQILLCVYGNFIFQIRTNPFALLLVSVSLSYHAYLLLRSNIEPEGPKTITKWPLLHGGLGILLIVASGGALSKIWAKYPDPASISDVLPQMQHQALLFFSGRFPYVPIKTLSHEPFPVYLPLQWAPFQLSNATGMDVRWPGIILFSAGIFTAGYFLKRRFSASPNRSTLPAMLLFALPLWGFIKWSKLDLGVSSEGIVAFWYLLLATGLAVREKPLIVIGIIGGLLSRYSLLFWLPLFALLLWHYAPRRDTIVVWGTVAAAVLSIFVLPFLAKDPTILQKMATHYAGCDERSWVHPDEYTYKEGLSLNIHVREWLPGAPSDNLAFAHWPQFLVQLACIVFGFWYYKKRGYKEMDIYTYSLLWLSIMPMLLYLFSPMLFRYYMLMPLSVSALLCWRVLAITKAT